jgi:hypothetical protein
MCGRSRRVEAPGRRAIDARLRDRGLDSLTQQRFAEKSDPAVTLTPRTRQAPAIVQIVHTLVDIMVVDEVLRESMGRPWVTAVFDIATRVVLGFALRLVGRPSLYAIFGDKRAIFMRALKAYAERKGALAAIALLSPGTLRDSLASFLRQAVESATEKGSAPGCLLVCVAPLVDDAEVRKFLQNAAVGAVTLVEGRFRDGISAGDIPSDFPVTCARSKSRIWRVG